MELVRVDQYKQLAKDTDKLLMKVENQSKQMFDVIEKLLISELKDLQKKGKNLKPTEFVDFITRAENYKAIQKRINATSNSYLDSFFNSYKNEISNLKNLYGKDFNIVGIEEYYDKMKNLVNQSTNILDLFTQNKGQMKLLAFSNEALLFNTQTQPYIDLLSKTFNKSFGQAKTILATSQKAVFNQIRQDYYKNLNIKDKQYIYLGPDDNITRPFCQKYINQIKTESEWKKISNGQTGSAWDTQGGYGCRHQLILIQPENIRGQNGR